MDIDVRGTQISPCPHGGPDCMIYQTKSDGIYGVCTLAASVANIASGITIWGDTNARRKAGCPNPGYGILGGITGPKCKFATGRPVKVT